MCSCNGHQTPNTNSNVIFNGQKWDVVKLNDSIFVCLPGLNASSDLTPVIINIHH